MGQEQGRSEARVRGVLLEPMAGLKRRRGVTAEAQEREAARIARKLAYMSEANLRGLCELALKQARGVWPETALILSWGYGLQVPPPSESDYVGSLMRSAMGRAARDGGYLVELMRMAKRLGPPPGRYMLSKLREEAADNARRREGLRRMIDKGTSLRREDLEWLNRYHADLAQAEAMLADDAGEGAAGCAA
ncbi:hypothetical protein CKO11_12420 [Rhodobacter sp. TJ_12]|uniref:hypothetical protein n=1 Tax=Rhodobacter sp. TJ_12 TaxID=2029399 RepID=UPI001CC03CC9|nr:hypothetical protein [Rhodobacter sp. TJ_12]MBZ4023263.1 hypothetical protein [Rhodobacter sp. TJ_12]